jgi:hypothetical protein
MGTEKEYREYDSKQKWAQSSSRFVRFEMVVEYPKKKKNSRGLLEIQDSIKLEKKGYA